jgi:hypothetical protein
MKITTLREDYILKNGAPEPPKTAGNPIAGTIPRTVASPDLHSERNRRTSCGQLLSSVNVKLGRPPPAL